MKGYYYTCVSLVLLLLILGTANLIVCCIRYEVLNHIAAILNFAFMILGGVTSLILKKPLDNKKQF